MKFKYLITMRRAMVWLNFIIIVFIATQFLFISRYINEQQESYLLLNRLSRIPPSPVIIFWQCVFAFIALVVVMTFRHHTGLDLSNTNNLSALEFVLTILVFLACRMNYNGIFLLYFVDILLSNRNLPGILHFRYWFVGAIILLLTFTFSDFSFVGNYFEMPNINTYVSFLPVQSATALTFIKNFLTALNMIFFVCLSFAYIIFLLNRQHQIEDQLHQVTRANAELKNYANLSEKIAQDRERKRIARDIHDTIGHALTGVAAGIDAVMVLIDVNPDAAKEQLQKISVAVKQGLKDVRKVLNQMRPGALENYTLEASLRKMLKEYSDLSHVKINFDYQWGKVTFAKTTENVIFRIIEETVTNSLRHGHATQIDIHCQTTQNCYQMIIHNNGKSIEHIKPGFGITQMKERVAIINGKISFDGHDGFTTTVLLPKEGIE